MNSQDAKHGSDSPSPTASLMEVPMESSLIPRFQCESGLLVMI